MTLAGGMGDVVNAGKGTLLDSFLGEEMIAIPGENCNVWVLVHKLNDPIIEAYEVTASGVRPTPVYSFVGSMAGPYAWSMALFKCSPNRRKLVIAKNITNTIGWPNIQGVDLYDFDPATGMVSNCQVLEAMNGAYGAEFSPDNSKLYTEQAAPIGILQYDVTLPTTAAIVASVVTVGICTNSSRTDMKLGPDGKIYFNTITAPYGSSLDCISSPNLPGSACGFISHAVSLGFSTFTGFPNLVWTVDTSQDITGPNVICAGTSDTFTDATPGGIWSSGNPLIATIDSASGVIYGVIPGVVTVSYNFTLGNCPAVKIVTVTATSAGNITGPPKVCVNATIALTKSVPGGVWSCSNSHATVSGSGVVTGVSGGIDTILYTVTGMCGPATATHVVTVHALPATGTISGLSAMCPGSFINLTETVAGGTWSSSNALVAVVGSAGKVTGITNGIVNITYKVTDSFCSANAIKSVTVNPLPDAGTITHSTLLAFCIGYKMKLIDNKPGGTWSVANSRMMVTGDTLVAVSPGTDTVYYTFTNSCGTAIASLSLDVLPPPTLPYGDKEICVGDTTVLKDSIAGGMWYGGGAVSLYTPFLDSAVIVGKSAGLAVITYSIDPGCSITTVITVDPLPDAGIIAGPDTVCSNLSFTVTDSIPGGKWIVAQPGIITIDSISGMVNSLTAGSTVIIYKMPPNIYGCTNRALFPVSVIPGADFTVGGIVVPPNCYGSTGSIAVSINGGNGPYQYLWNNGDTSATITGITAGTYAVFTEEMKTMCRDTGSFIVNQPDSLQITADMHKDVCKTNSGSINATVTGGTTAYQYLWSNNATGNEITGLPAGTYTISVTDAHGCVKELSLMVEDSVCSPVIIHDGISPNGDGVNDTWIIEAILEHPRNVVQVYDKYGDLVFEQPNYQNDWNGIGKDGNKLPDGTYYYLVKLNDDNYKTNVFKGALMVKR